MAAFWLAPATKHLALELLDPCQQSLVFEKILFVFVQTLFPTIFINWEGIGPDTFFCPRHINCHVPSNVYMRGILQPVKKTIVSQLPKILHLHIYYCRLLSNVLMEQYLLSMDFFDVFKSASYSLISVLSSDFLPLIRIHIVEVIQELSKEYTAIN